MADTAISPPARQHRAAPCDVLDPSPVPDTVLEFSGRFRFGIDQWAYVPFTVPPGVRSLRVSTRHQKFVLAGVARNVLDLGVFGAAGYELGNSAGFRGWSGGAREGFMVSAGAATPGYLPGPIAPGTWALALGPVVLNPLGMAWSAQVTLEHGEPEHPRPVTVPRPAPAPGRGPRWYRGDLHTHTVHSDGRYRPEELTTAAAAAGLDFLVSTEHNTNAANLAWPAPGASGPTIVAGEEVTTRHGHWLAVGLPADSWIDWRYAPRDDAFPGFATQARALGALVVAAHPAVPVPGAAWEFGYRDVDAIEVWNGIWNLDDEVSLRIWHRLLTRGRRVAAVGGSDSHGEHQRVGHPQTVVFADELDSSALVAGLRGGRCYLAESQAVTVDFRAAADTGGTGRTVAGTGDVLAIGPGAAVTVDVTVTGAPDCVATVITAEGQAARVLVDANGSARLRCSIGGSGARFARVEIRRIGRRRRGSRGSRESMVALTNPIWFADAVG